MLTGSVWASTDFGVGTITAVEENARTFQVQYEFYNYKPADIWPEGSDEFDFSGGWGQRCYFLDGKPVATAEEALAVGRSIAMVDDGMAVFVSNKPDFFFLDQHGTIEDGLCRITLENAASMRYAVIENGKPGVTRDMRHPVELLVDLSSDGMRGILVVPPLQKGFTDHELDCSKLMREGNVLSGTISFSAKPTQIQLDGAEKIELAHEFKLTFGEKGAVSGTWSGVLNGKSVTGAVSGVTLARRPVTPENTRVWLQVTGDDGGSKGWQSHYIVMTMKEGKVEPGGYVCMKKGAIEGDVLDADLKLTGTTLSGTLRYKFGAVRERRVECRILGGKWIAGSVVDGDTKSEPCRGGFCAVDSVPIRKCTIEEYAIIRAMQPEGSTGRILTYGPILKYLEELKATGKSLPEAPKMKPVAKPERTPKKASR
jgi:hypothetical protein